jgi:hypothetical protein
MYLPLDLQIHINEYAKPLCRLDWREGSYCNRHYMFFKYFLKQSVNRFILKRIERNILLYLSLIFG